MTRRLLAPLVALLVLWAGLAAAGARLIVLHSNDVHARFDPAAADGAECAEAEAAGCMGGAARRMAAIGAERKTARAAGVPLVLLDAGDRFQGSLFFTHYKGQLTARLMNALGYDAMAVGNHEFDEGPDVLARFAAALEFPLLMANARMPGAPDLAARIAPATMIERGGLRIGVVGLITPDTARGSRPGAGVRFSDPATALRAQISALREKRADVVIALTHLGLRADRALAHAVPGVDVIVGGHSHTALGTDDAPPYPLMVNGVAVVQAGAYGRHLGRLSLEFGPDGGLSVARGGLLPLTPKHSADQEIAAMIRQAAKPLAGLRGDAVADLPQRIGGATDRRCRRAECAIGNLVADAMLAHPFADGAEVALMNGGGLRADLGSGSVSRADLTRVLPFSNRLARMRLTGAALRAALEHALSRIGSGAFLQVAGLRLRHDPAAPPGARLRGVTVAGAPLEDGRLYTVVTNDFLRQGGDGYTMLAGAVGVDDRGPKLVTVLAGYLRSGAVSAAVEGRIRKVK